MAGNPETRTLPRRRLAHLEVDLVDVPDLLSAYGFERAGLLISQPQNPAEFVAEVLNSLPLGDPGLASLLAVSPSKAERQSWPILGAPSGILPFRDRTGCVADNACEHQP